MANNISSLSGFVKYNIPYLMGIFDFPRSQGSIHRTIGAKEEQSRQSERFKEAAREVGADQE
jgi:hypothetical protein